jgi:hypothetical protein
MKGPRVVGYRMWLDVIAYVSTKRFHFLFDAPSFNTSPDSVSIDKS